MRPHSAGETSVVHEVMFSRRRAGALKVTHRSGSSESAHTLMALFSQRKADVLVVILSRGKADIP